MKSIGHQSESGPVRLHAIDPRPKVCRARGVATFLALAGAGWAIGCNPDGSSQGFLNLQARVSGRIIDSTGAGVPSILVVAAPGGGSGVTGATGAFSFQVPNGWSGDLIPSSIDYRFTPASIRVNNVRTHRAENDFLAAAAPTAGSNRSPLLSPHAGQVAPGQMANLSLVATDADNDPLTFSIVSQPAHGTLGPVVSSSSNSATIVYTPAAGYQGPDAFTFLVSDGRAAAGPAPFSIVVGQAGGPALAGTVVRLVAAGQTQPVSGLALRLTGAGTSAGQDFTVVTDAAGVFRRALPAGWSGEIGLHDPAAASLNPASRSFSNVQFEQSGIQFTAGRNFYVSPGGNDGAAGTLEAPFKTIQRAANILSPGDACIIRQGVYNETVTVNADGLPGAPLVFRAYPGEKPAIDGQNTRDYGFYCPNATDVVMDGIGIRRVRLHGVYLEDFADRCTVRNCEIHDVGLFGIYLRGGDDCLIEYNECYNCRVGIRIQRRDTNNNFVHRAVVRFNLLHDLTDDPEENDGIAASAAIDCLFEHNFAWRCADDGIDVSASSSGQDFCTGCIVRFNAVWSSGHLGEPGDGNGIKVSTNAGGGHLVHHNICFANTRAGFDQDIESGWNANRFYNNLAYANVKAGFIIEGSNTDQGRATLQNNIGWANDAGTAHGLGDFFTHHRGVNVSNFNVWGVAVYQEPDPGHTEGPNTLQQDPRIANPGAAINVNLGGIAGIPARWQFLRQQLDAAFALTAASPCINSGILVPGVTIDIVGAPDRGPLEFATP